MQNSWVAIENNLLGQKRKREIIVMAICMVHRPVWPGSVTGVVGGAMTHALGKGKGNNGEKVGRWNSSNNLRRRGNLLTEKIAVCNVTHLQYSVIQYN